MILTFAPNSLSPRSTFRSCVPCVVSSQSHCFSISTPNSHAPSYFSYKRGCAVVGACGKARLIARASSSSPNIAEDLGDISIFSASGEPVMFKHLWDQNEGIAVVALLRHFGCFFCWELASALKEYKPRFDAAGVKLIAVGVGTPNKARILAERLPFPMDCLYADPERKAYNVWTYTMAKVFLRYDDFKEALENYTIGATPDDISVVLQQGGMIVFKGKQLLYARKDERAGDHAPLNDIFDVCCKTPVA